MPAEGQTTVYSTLRSGTGNGCGSGIGSGTGSSLTGVNPRAIFKPNEGALPDYVAPTPHRPCAAALGEYRGWKGLQ